jgi:hypothetical protein
MRAPLSAWLVLLAVSLAACATPSTAGLTPWDQARVTGLSQQVLADANALHLALLQQGRGSGRLQQLAIAIQQQSAALAAHLEAGKGFPDTVYSYRDLREMMDDANMRVGTSYLEQPGQDAWARLAAALAELTPYYDTRPFGS